MGYGLTVTVVPRAAPPGAVAVIVAVPAATAVTRPVALTVATAGLLVVHVNATPGTGVAPAYPVAVSCCVVPRPVMVGLAGLTVTVAPRTPRRITPALSPDQL